MVLGTPSTAALVVQPRGRAKRVLSTDGDQAVEFERGESVAHDLHAAAVALERVGARGAEDRAAAGQDAGGGLDGQLARVALERTAPAISEAHDLVAVDVDPPAHDRADRRVQAGTVATPCEHTHAHRAKPTPTVGRSDCPLAWAPRF
jgi:hypothetical protein